MSLLTNTGRISGSLLTSFRAQSDLTAKPKMFKGVKNIKYNAFIKNQRQPTIRYRKGNYRQVSQCCKNKGTSLEGLYVYPKPVPMMMNQFVDECRFNGGYNAPVIKYSGFVGMKKKIYPIGNQLRRYAAVKEPGSPASKGGAVAASGGGLGKLDSANESGFFHKVNKSRIDQIKQRLRDKALKDKKEPK